MNEEALVAEFLCSPEPESTMRRHVHDAISQLRDSAATRDRRARTTAPLELLLVGYSGAGNVGADVRVIELVRQLNTIFDGTQPGVRLTLTTVGEHLPRHGLDGVNTVLVNSYMPNFLSEHCGAADAVVACEGSMFKSNFSDTLSMLMAGALGMASAGGKPAIAYGAEAGQMNDELQDFVSSTCTDALVICRNERSREVLAPLGLRTALGADPAWTFAAAPAARAEEILRGAGWDGEQPVVTVCPMNPFWWPVRPDVARAHALETTGAHRDEHYVSVFFHNDSDVARQRYDTYVAALVRAVDACRRTRGWFAVVVGMERLDLRACRDVAQRLGAPVLVSGDLEPEEIVAVLRRSRLLVSSRYHALLTAMAGGVAGVGVSMDERIDTLLDELGRPGLRVAVDDPQLEQRVLQAIAELEDERDALGEAIGALAADQLRRLGLAGIALADELQRGAAGAGPPALERTWRAYLPPLTPRLHALLEAHA